MKSGWFEIILPSLQMRVTDKISAAHKAAAAFTMTRLKLDNGEKIVRWRRHYYVRFQAGQLNLDGLRVFAPLVADAVEREQFATSSASKPVKTIAPVKTKAPLVARSQIAAKPGAKARKPADAKKRAKANR